MEAIILAGGMGTRLQPIVTDIPKVLAPVAKKPFIEYLFAFLKKSGVQKAVLSVGYKKEVIKEKYAHSYQGLQLLYSEEEVPLGTGGALQQALSLCTSENIYVLNGDSLFLIELPSLMDLHKKRKASLAMAVKKLKESERFGGVIFEPDGKIISFREKEGKDNYINGGIYCIHSPSFEKILNPFIPPYSLEKDVFPHALQQGFPFFALPATGYFIDIGVPSSFAKANEELKNSLHPLLSIL